VTGGRLHVLRTGLGLLVNPLVLILLAASVFSGIVGEALDAGIIVTFVLVSVGVDFFQMFHSEQAASKLQSLATLTATVCRDAQLTDIPMRLVAGRCSGAAPPGHDRQFVCLHANTCALTAAWSAPLGAPYGRRIRNVPLGR
jgi:hypothetical protein